jgi:ferric-dicitrate binding protein FerR (iron transport regulator)
MAAFILYGTVISTLLGCAASAADRLFVSRSWPRRGVWFLAMLASLAIPFIAIFVDRDLTPSGAPPVVFETATGLEAQATEPVGSPAQSSRTLAVNEPWPTAPALDGPLGAAWAIGSGGLLLLYAGAWIRLRNAAGRWRLHQVDGYSISVTRHTGPSVMGCFKPRILLPVWVLSAPGRVASYVLAHEQQHVVAKDTMLWMASLVLVALFPWNVALWWQLRQLRFAIESDCDVRVVKRTRNPCNYAAALLEVGKHRGAMRHEFTLGSSLRASQIERRVSSLLVDPRPVTLPRQLLLAAAVAFFAAMTCVTQVPARPSALRLSVSNIPQIFVLPFAALMPETLVTHTGETRTVRFEDGSIVYMNTRTLLERLVHRDHPSVSIVEGETFFDVVRDENRLFRVVVDDSEIRTRGARFNVYRKSNGEVIVTVLYGMIDFRRTSEGRNGPTWRRQLHAGERILYRPIGLVRDVHSTNALNAVRWRDGVLIVANEPLGDVLGELTRYTDRRIVVRDPRVAQIRISGAVSTRDVRKSLDRIAALEPSIQMKENDNQFELSFVRSTPRYDASPAF